VADGAAARPVGLLGAGVIGAGWAARFLLHGVDVRVFDPDARAEEHVRAAVENARRAYAALMTVPLPAEGELTVAASPEDAARGVGFVQESVPEREELKRDLLAAAGTVTPADVVIASSTSGLLPSRLQAGVPHPERVVVGHPFHPVYLLPLVEVCGGSETAPAAIEQAEGIYRAVGMSPLRVRKEIDGFVADRLLEALWREALWLVADGVATVGEIDDAIRFGAGLRWSFMGTFLAYRMAGGDTGMRGFLEHFGPALEWPWTKLMDVPELTGELVDRIAAQSDAQADGRSLHDLERERDDCLVAVLQALRSCGAGAGAVLAEHEERLRQA
jgi:carnitine 3-dehydrogenase